MEKFTDFLLKVYEDDINKIIVTYRDDEPIDNFFIDDLKDYINGVIKYENEYFEYLDNLFKELPKSIWKDEAIYIIAELDVLMRQEDVKIYNSNTKHLRTKKANLLKKDDIKSLKKVIPILQKFFECEIGGTKIEKLEDVPADIDLPLSYYNGYLTKETIETLINDITKGNYDQGFYYEQRGAKKEDLKNHLLRLNKKYNVEKSRDIHDFIKYLNPYQYANL